MVTQRNRVGRGEVGAADPSPHQEGDEQVSAGEDAEEHSPSLRKPPATKGAKNHRMHTSTHTAVHTHAGTLVHTGAYTQQTHHLHRTCRNGRGLSARRTGLRPGVTATNHTLAQVSQTAMHPLFLLTSEKS